MTDAAPPLIGITTSELRRREQVRVNPQGEPPQTELALGLSYPDAVLRAGGVPVIVTPLSGREIESLLSRLDGLVLSGGPDLHPAAYRQDPHDALGPTEPDVDAFELALCREAIALGLPLLGICRGAQVINVACGGSLHQHLPDIVGESIIHRQDEPGWEGTHVLRVREGSRLATMVGPDPLLVNSFHHQGIDSLAPGLAAVAHATDGVIEAIEGHSDSLLLGVQWHVESMVGDARQLALVQALVASASRRRSAGPTSIDGPTDGPPRLAEFVS